MKKVYLIRHALPAFINDQRMCIGITDLPICARGKEQAAAMAATLPPVTAVFSSPLRRAVQTAASIGMPITILDGLRELHAGQWDGLTFEQIRQRYPELYAARAHDQTLPLPGAEDPQEGLVRFRQAMEAAARQAPGDFAVVAHGGIIGKFIQSLTGVFRKPDYTEVVPLIWDHGTFYLQEEP